MGGLDIGPSLGEELFTIQFRSLDLLVPSLMIPTIIIEVDLVLDILDEDDEGWTLATRRRFRKQILVEPPLLHRRKRQGKKMNPRCPKGKKRSNAGKKHKAQPIDLLEQEPPVPVTLEEFFIRDFFNKVVVNRLSCFGLQDEDDEEDEQKDTQKASSANTYDKVLTILEALPSCMSWK